MFPHILRLAGVLFIILISGMQVHAVDKVAYKARVDSLKGWLAIAPESVDSIGPLYKLFDMTEDKYGRMRYADLLYKVSLRADAPEVSFDMLRHMVNMSIRNDSLIAYYDKEIKKFKPSPQQRSTQLFIDLHKIDNLMYNRDNKEIENVDDFVKRISDNIKDDYDRVIMLYAICRYLGQEGRGESLEEYINNLTRVAEGLDMEDGAVLRMIYSRAAPVYYESDNYVKCYETDLKMLHEIDKLEEAYLDQGRVYHTVGRHRYNCYRRMMGCYPIVNEGEIENIYSQILKLAEENESVARDMEGSQRVNIYYAMATGDYQRAKKLLAEHLDDPSMSSIRLQLARMLREASAHTNDHYLHDRAITAISEEMERRIAQRNTSRLHEIQLKYDYQAALDRNAHLEASKHEEAIRARTITIIIGSIAIILLLILAVVLFNKNRHIRHLAKTLEQSNEHLRRERDDLKKTQQKLTEISERAAADDRRKTEFINNMSHEVKVPMTAIAEYTQLISDCIPDDQAAYLDRFASIILTNVRMVLRLMNDVLDTDSIENGQMSIEKRPTSINDICHMAIDNVFEGGFLDNENIKFVFEPQCPDTTTIETDDQRVAQVLINLLLNARKFSDDGTITLGYKYDKAGKQIEFYVSDQGRGIPDGRQEDIFKRFCRLDHTVPGCGLGLYISRLIVEMLGGKIAVDPTYKGGARIAFTIPTEPA